MPSTTPDPGTILLYALSTLAQTCAALAAFVGAVGIYKLQLQGNEHVRNEQTIRGLLFHILDRPAQVMPLDEILQIARNQVANPNPALPASAPDILSRALAERDDFPRRHWQVTTALFTFEGWNLLVIGASLVGFNYIPELVSSPWTFWGVWAAAVGTVAVTA